MPTTDALSVEVLGRITLLQSMVTLMPEPRSMLTFVCQGLADVSGVQNVEYILFDGNAPWPKAPPAEQPTTVLEVKSKATTFAQLRFVLRDAEAFLPYLPFLKNFANMLGVVLEEYKQRAINQQLLVELEERVAARTRELAIKSEDLRRSEERYREIVEGTSDLITTVDAQGNFTYVNHRAQEIFGTPPAQCHGRAFMDCVHPEDRAATFEWWSRCLEQHLDRAHIENRQTNAATQEVFHLLWTCAFHTDAQGQLLYVNSIGHDNSDRRRAQEEQAKYEAQLQQNQKLESLGVLAGGIAHDFNNLMGGIYGSIDVALAINTDPEIEVVLGEAMSSIDRARGLTQQLLTFARGGAPIQQVQALFPLVEEVARFALSGSSVTCQFQVPPELWACRFDKNQLSQVIQNLVINAQQAMLDGGTIHISANNVRLEQAEHASLAPGQYVVISLRDSGVGIPAEILPRIFEPFFSTKTLGHGLGLATCYSIAKRHGGAIEVLSQPGHGSEFRVFLPATSAALASTPPPSPVEHRGHGTIVVMDDERIIRETIAAMLQSCGYDVACHASGAETLGYIRAALRAGRQLAGVIVDLTVPGGMGGKALVTELRKLAPQLPVFVASGYAEDPIMKDPQAHGFNASLCKPFRKRELAELLSQHIAQPGHEG